MQLLTSPPLPLQGAYNVRDLGGYTTEDGLTTRSGVFLRADGLHNLTDTDIQQLYTYGLRRVIDLRSQEEARQMPYSFEAYPEVQQHHVPMLDRLQSAGFHGSFFSTMGELYVNLLDESGQLLARALRLLVDAPGCALFHCTAGKDRTGTLAMLLLKLAHVPDEQVVADYAVTEEYMHASAELQKIQLRAQGMEIPDYVFESPPDNMEYTLRHLSARYGSCEAYLSSIGLTEAEQQLLRGKLLGISASDSHSTLTAEW